MVISGDGGAMRAPLWRVLTRPEGRRMSQADLLRLLELAHPGRPQADLLAMIEATPGQPRAKPTGKPVQRRVGSQPANSGLDGKTPLLGCLWASAADKLQALIETMVELIEESGGSAGHA